MAGGKDRDARETIKPPASVAAQIASGKIAREDPTPVGPIPVPPSELDPDRPSNSRAQVGDLDALKTHVDTQLATFGQAVDTQLATFGHSLDSVAKTGSQLSTAVVALQAGHEDIRDTVDGLKDGVELVRKQNDEQNKTLADVRVEAREARTLTKSVAADIKAIRRRQETVAIKREGAAIDDEFDAKKQKRDFWWYFVRGMAGILITALTSLAAIGIEHLVK